MGEKSCLYSLKKPWKLFKWRDKIQTHALLCISYLREIEYYVSTLKPLIVTFYLYKKYWYIFPNLGFTFVCRYIQFFKQTAAILFVVIFCYFSHNIFFFLNVALILFDVHYFDAESSKKKELSKVRCTKLHIYRWRPFCICFSPKLCKISKHT